MGFPFATILNSAPLLAQSGTWWHPWDTAIVLTAAAAAMSCTLPGIWLVLRQQSMMGDALSHTTLPGIVIAFLGINLLRAQGWITPEFQTEFEPVVLAIGAIAIGILTAVLTEWVQKLGRVESSAALGVVFVSMFALGILLLRLKADDVDIDPNCVLFGQLQLVVFDTVNIAGWDLPRAFLANGILFVINGCLMLLFYKELRLAAFDPELATSLGINAGALHYVLMGVTAATVVMAFTTVGSILVVALLIIPAACGQVLCHRLGRLTLVALLVALLSAVLGHVLAKALPNLLFAPLGFTQVDEADTSGMVAVACGMFLLLAIVFSPNGGLLSQWASRLMMTWKMAADDLMATLYRYAEQNEAGTGVSIQQLQQQAPWIPGWIRRLSVFWLRRQGLIIGTSELQLTAAGSAKAALLVRSHRLWESYLHKHFSLPDDRLHKSAHVVEHYLNSDLQAQLSDELDSPSTDPHGKPIPESEGDAPRD